MQTRTENTTRAPLALCNEFVLLCPVLAQAGARGMGSHGEAGMRAVFAEAGLDDFTRIAESPNIVYEARPRSGTANSQPHHFLMTSTATPNHNVGSVMANAAFRGVLASNIMASIALGTAARICLACR